MRVIAVRTRVFKKNDELPAFVRAHIKKIPEKTVVVIASKIVALSEGRTAEAKDKVTLIKKESVRSRKTRYAWLTVKGGMAMANAGVDESNAKDGLVLLPKDSFRSAAKLRAVLRRSYKIKNLGVVISDSAVSPLRAGVTAHALGYAGIKGIRDYRGTKDLFGRKMSISRTNVADSLATAAALVMGEGAERQPLALVTEAPVIFVEKTNRKETNISAKDDLFGPMLKF